MKDNNSPLNFFHQTAKKELPTTAQKQAPTATAVQSEIHRTNSMMNDMHEMQSKIEEELEKLIKVTGFSKEQVWQFLERSHNFKTEQWEKAQASYKDLKEKVGSALIIEPSDLAALPTRVQTKEQHRKAKFTGARRNWLSTR